MKILLNPSTKTDDRQLRSAYLMAVGEAVELLIVSAYLTDWSPGRSLSGKCRSLTFVVGTDFGITRKAACRKVLAWLPKHFKNDFLAADGISGFHPKLVAWKTGNGKQKLIIGSSNLTNAAFDSNHEANALVDLSEQEYRTVRDWIYSIRLKSLPISDDWIESYHEQKALAGNKKGKTALAPVIRISLPKGRAIDLAIKERRRNQRAFGQISKQLLQLCKACASAEMSNSAYYDQMYLTWGHHASRFQGKGFFISGKHSNWRQTCGALIRIVDFSKSMGPIETDSLVKKEIDALATAGNPSRGSWLTEMLCHYLPKRYPLLNRRTRKWLEHIEFRSPRSASEGSTYIDLAIKLRAALKENDYNEANDMAEIDGAISKWFELTF